ncbi:hypothetical protein EJ06DRAFT_531579 [Trichodelitschia bisporula]|uniref:Uncharacterized protein n=1 Tax=Trichodelitschia bisporula TaxID=703511 RepID=A0A6G1HTL7_9PEZI|nr:hypothetical protein EJ06DRAFT_531579 [Trichodelitschia bisporula]
MDEICRDGSGDGPSGPLNVVPGLSFIVLIKRAIHPKRTNPRSLKSKCWSRRCHLTSRGLVGRRQTIYGNDRDRDPGSLDTLQLFYLQSLPTSISLSSTPDNNHQPSQGYVSPRTPRQHTAKYPATASETERKGSLFTCWISPTPHPIHNAAGSENAQSIRVANIPAASPASHGKQQLPTHVKPCRP